MNNLRYLSENEINAMAKWDIVEESEYGRQKEERRKTRMQSQIDRLMERNAELCARVRRLEERLAWYEREAHTEEAT